MGFLLPLAISIGTGVYGFFRGADSVTPQEMGVPLSFSRMVFYAGAALALLWGVARVKREFKASKGR